MRSIKQVRTVFGSPIHLLIDEADAVIEWNARWHRKGRSQVPGTTNRISTWIAVLFGVGSILFIVGGFAFLSLADRLASWLNLIGSIAFSIGATLTVLEAANATSRLGLGRSLRTLWTNTGGKASLIQFVSAVGLFQLAMVAAMFPNLDWIDTDLLVWTPSSLGSVGFVVASYLFVREALPAGDIGLLASIGNLVGSVCFLAGSLDGYFAEGPLAIVDPDVSTWLYTFGSVVFLIGSILALIEVRRRLKHDQTPEIDALVTQTGLA